MTRLIACPFLLSSASLLLPVIVDTAAKGLALLPVTGTGILAVRGASASWRHFIWVSAMAGLFVLPIMSYALPSWRVLPSWFDDSVAVVSDASVARAPVVVETEAIELTQRANAPPVWLDAEPYVDIAPAKAGFTTETSEATQGDETIGVPPFGESIAVLVAAIWVAGGAILLTRLVLSGFVLSYVASKSKRLTCGKVHDEFLILRKRLGIRRDVQILQSDRRTVPMTWGVLKARVLLPSDSDSWDDERLRAVLLHELAHVKRCDSLMHLLVQITCTLHWFNPLVWIAAWRIRVERERACDDVVLNSGVKPSDYAEHLLGIATGYVGRQLAGLSAVAMATKGRLEGRLLSMLDGTLSRRELSLGAVASSILVTVSIVLPLAMIQAADNSQDVVESDRNTLEGAGQASPVEKASHSEEDKLDLRTVLESIQLAEAKPRLTKPVSASDQNVTPRIVQGCVLTPDGKPVGGARIYLWRWNWVLNHDTCQVNTLSKEDGRFEFLLMVPSDEAQAFVVCALADGFGAAIGYAAPHLPDGDLVQAMYGVKRDGTEQPKGTLLLSEEDTPITGRVVDVEGRPIRRAHVRLSGLSEGHDVDLTDWLEYMKGKSSDKTPMHFFAVPKVKEFSAATDDEGRFQLRGIGPERVIQLLITGESIECRGVYVMTRKEPSFSAPRHPDGVKAVIDFTYHGSTFVHAAGPTTPVVGVVRDADTNAPLPGVRVRPARLAGIPIDNPFRYGYVEAVTDEDGRYRLVGLPRGVNLVEAVPAHVPDLDVHKVRATLTVDTSSGGGKPVQADVLYLKRQPD